MAETEPNKGWNWNHVKREVAVPGNPGWAQVESEVCRPGRWLALSIGSVFTLIGAIGFLTIGNAVPPGFPLWAAKLGTAVFASLGGLVVAWAVGGIILPIHVRHAAPDTLPNVPQEPVIREGSVVHGRLTHELCEDSQGWQFRPVERLWRNDKRFLLGFGIPFLLTFSALVAWVGHSQWNFGWFLSAACGTMITLVCGGSTFILIGMILRSGYRRLSRLSIPRNGDSLELDAPEEPRTENADLIEGLKWLFQGDAKRQRLAIPRELVKAVQLCPWKFVVTGGGREITWAVQGLLVLASPSEETYCRLPLMLTSDFVGAARLMGRLAFTLNVPYLFCADAEGWKAEEMRARERSPLRHGGSQS
jgi:hypothetical protein